MNSKDNHSMQEIERKFLVTNTNFKQEAFQQTHLVQGYLNSTPERTVRIRVSNEQAWITVKGKSSADGTSRFEWEKEIPLQEAKQLLALCEEFLIEKTRYLVKAGKHTFEVDEFHGKHNGLLMAEVELQDAKETFEKPVWLGQEVTGQKEYYNAYLKSHPIT